MSRYHAASKAGIRLRRGGPRKWDPSQGLTRHAKHDNIAFARLLAIQQAADNNTRYLEACQAAGPEYHSNAAQDFLRCLITYTTQFQESLPRPTRILPKDRIENVRERLAGFRCRLMTTSEQQAMNSSNSTHLWNWWCNVLRTHHLKEAAELSGRHRRHQ